MTDYVNEEIRLGRLTRAEGIQIVNRYDDAQDFVYVKNYCDYLSISINDFWNQVYKAVNLKLFSIDQDGRIHRKFTVGVGL